MIFQNSSDSISSFSADRFLYNIQKTPSVKICSMYFANIDKSKVERFIESNRMTFVAGNGDYHWIFSDESNSSVVRITKIFGAKRFDAEIAFSDPERFEEAKIIFKQFQIDEKEKTSFYILTNSGSLSLSLVQIESQSLELAINYGQDFEPKHHEIVGRLNLKEKGLYIFHGEPGTGKTSYIKYLASIVKNRKFIYVPSSFSSFLADPSFAALMCHHPNSVIIIEDAEKVVESRSTSGDSGLVSNVLNLSDGILGSLFNTSIILTFNTELDKIDPALKRKGRMLAMHYFGPLSAEDSRRTAAYLKKDIKISGPTILADIYNAEVDNFVEKENERKIGF